MKISITKLASKKLVKAIEMAEGQVGIIRTGKGYRDQVVLRSFRCIVSLTHDGVMWNWGTDDGGPSFDIEVLPAGSQLQIEVAQ
ncbi:MAG: hypothetical protein KGL39_14300 [Patescibacteria group bacterium]|nr:hypothetical protein [Patescibacteria group bacterium]